MAANSKAITDDMRDHAANEMMKADHRREDEIPPSAKIKNYYEMADAFWRAAIDKALEE